MQNYDLSGLKVLVVEDSSFMVKLLRIMLGAFGVKRIEHVKTRADFIHQLKKFGPDLILTDWEMPYFSGRTVADIVRHHSDPKTTFTPLFAISGYTERDKIEAMLLAGVDDVIAKPVSAKDLFSRITRFIATPPQYVRGENYFGPERNLRTIVGDEAVNKNLEGKQEDVVWL